MYREKIIKYNQLNICMVRPAHHQSLVGVGTEKPDTVEVATALSVVADSDDQYHQDSPT